MAIWQDLVDTCGFTGSYQSVQRFVQKLRPGTSLEACAVIETAPGEECQVDYGTGPMVRDPVTGKYRRTRLFVMTLGYSRKSVRLLEFRSSSQIWAELHEKAFRRLTGATRVVVLCNLREGISKRSAEIPLARSPCGSPEDTFTSRSTCRNAGRHGKTSSGPEVWFRWPVLK
jgi:transposase